MPPFVSNLRVYLTIALEAAAESRRLLEEGRTPRGDGGFIVRLDPEQRSFKHSLIAIAFAGTFLEALLGIVAVERLGSERYKSIDKRKWEVKLQALGITDDGLLARCTHFREARNDLMHEKPLDWDNPSSATFFAGQEEASLGVEFVLDVATQLRRLDLVPSGWQKARPS